ncbi:nickel ABC transporter permease [Paenibacillus sp. SYP-B4298]|uniref:nickel ABC transporter permease n=1 Tax=Paenibacillus sp. SYP-B4298 TaxID=2996034 RepID=UPI0022DE455F|nr:nickel ABC transporter permease [Paenibacillus sp. SYP-B4298]
MLRIFARRLTEIVIFLLLVTFISFLFLRLAPGDPVLTILNVDELAASQEQVEALREELGFNESLPIQYGHWLGRLLRLDLGVSYATGQPVMALIADSLPATLELTAGAIAVMVFTAVPLGSLAALYRGGWLDRLSRVLAVVGAAVPSFWLGLILIDLLGVRLGWLPTMGRNGFHSLLLPSLTLGLAMSSVYVRLLRSSLLDSLSQDFILAAHARGLSSWRIFWSYTFRHSLPPVITVFGVSLGSLIGGVVVIEVLFAYPGVGKLVVDSIRQRDYPMIQGYILVMALLIFIINATVDLACHYLNPEMRLQGRERNG